METGGFAPTYGVHLLSRTPIGLARHSILQAMQEYCPNVEPLAGDSDSALLSFIHPNHRIQFKEGNLPAQLVVAEVQWSKARELLEPALHQSWAFPRAREIVASCAHAVFVTDLLSSGLEYKERLSLFQQSLRGILSTIPCDAVHWLPTQQVVDPQVFLLKAAQRPSDIFFCGACNVRMFRLEGSDEMVMDTLGLAALGLPDLQCHFRGLEPNDVGAMLYNTALYVFESGDVIEDGHTVEGARPGSRWRCQHESSLLAPDRVVLDINPGVEFAGGNRS